MLEEVIGRKHFIMEPLGRFTESGLSFNYTKIDLGNYFQLSPANMTPESMTLSNERFAGDWQQWINALSDLATDVHLVYDNAFQLAIPPLDDRTVAALWVVAYGRQSTSLSTSSGSLLASIGGLATDQRQTALLDLVSALYGDYAAAMQDIQVTYRCIMCYIMMYQSHQFN